MENILEELKWRGAVNQVSDEAGLEELLAKNRSVFIVVSIRLVIVCILGT